VGGAVTAGAPATPEVVRHPWPTQVLLVDDAAEVRLLLRLRLEVEGFLVVAEAASCAEAIALVQEHLPEAVVLDVALRDGLQALGELHRRCPGIPVIVYSGLPEGEMAQRCVAAGASAFIEKSGGVDPLVQRLRAVTAARSSCPAAEDLAAADAGPPTSSPTPVRASGLDPPKPTNGERPLLLIPARWALPLAMALFAAVFVVRLTVDVGSTKYGFTMLYVLPISLLAARYGLGGGAAGALVAVLANVVWVSVAQADLGVVGFGVRAVTFFVVGVVVGLYADRVRQLLLKAAAATAEISVANRRLVETLEEVGRNYTELEASNGDLRQFGYIVSHDLAEPLRTMSGFSTLLETDFGDQLDERGVQYLGFIRDGASRMKALIDDLRLYILTGQQELITTQVPLSSVVDDVVAELGALLAERQAVVERDDLPTVGADRSLIALVVRNLVSNAVKFNESPVPRVRITSRGTVGGGFDIDVSDNGIGIDPTHQERVFALFARLHTQAEYPGTGLGLAICRRIVERRGGRIVSVPVDSGACIRLTFPPESGAAAC
jgi:signal transduction histidine kinase/CheY-like chemotaxis protein